MQRFGEKLRSLRIYHGITLMALSSALEYNTHSYISELESGRKIPTAALILKLSYLFSISTDQLMKDELEIDLDRSTYNSGQSQCL